MIELSADNLHEVLSQNEKVLVQYGAGWCGNCRLMKPKFKRFDAETEGVEFVYVDAERYPQSRKLADVSNLPTFAAFHNGTLINQVQTNRAENLETLVHEIANH